MSGGRRFICPFCEKSFTAQLNRHIKQTHQEEDEVKAITCLPKKEQAARLELLRNRGRDLHNQKALAGSGQQLIVRRKAKRSQAADFRVCSLCSACLHRRQFARHKCKAASGHEERKIPPPPSSRPLVEAGNASADASAGKVVGALQDPSRSRRTLPASAGKVVGALQDPSRSRTLRASAGKVIGALQDPRRRAIAGADPLIVKYVERYCAKHDMSEKNGQYVRETLNTLIRTVLCFREMGGNDRAGVKEMLQPNNFSVVVESAKAVAGLGKEGKMAAPYHASAIGRVLNE